MSFDLGVIVHNLPFLLLQGLLGIGAFGGGTLALAVPSIGLGFVLGVLVALARLSRLPVLYYPATLYVQVIRGVPLVMVIFWFWFFIPIAFGGLLLGLPAAAGDKFILAIPHFIVLIALYFLAGVVVFIAQFIILFSGSFPPGLHGLVVGYVRWSTRVSGYVSAFTDRYPPFSLS